MPTSRYANVVSTLALFLALGAGSAFAATQIGAKDIAKDAIRAKHIKASAVRSVEIQDGAVTSTKLAPGAVGSAALGDGSVTGAKVDESTLGVVPNATAWNGATVTQFNFALNDPTPLSAQLLDDSGTQVTAGCNNGATNEVDININTVGAVFPLGVNGQLLHSSSVPEAFVGGINPLSGVNRSAQFGDWTFMVRRVDGSMLVLHFWTIWTPASPPNECYIRGTRTNYPAP